MRVRLIVAFVVLAFVSQPAHAQDATVAGSVVDDSKAVMPGVTVTAADQATGRQFVAVTGERGEFRIPGMAPGRYQIQAALSGFATSAVQVELLVGQNATVNFALKVAALSESITVSSEAPLVDTRSSQIAGNVDRRQMEALPIQGRNWMELSLMVKGVTGNDVSSNRAAGVGEDSQFQLNLDGQQITEQVAGSSFGQPALSREAIAEYQIVTNLFDVTLGRSAGLQVQAISKSGGNLLSGSLFGYFRDDKFNTADFVVKRVLPYSNQQMGGTLGGPIVKDKVHYFASYEREREPTTIVVKPALYTQSLSFATPIISNNAVGRVDYQLTSKDHLMVRGVYSDRAEPFGQLTQDIYPSRAANREQNSRFVAANWSRVIGPSVLQELKVGLYHYHWFYDLAVGRGAPVVPTYNFPGGFGLGSPSNYPEEFWEDTPSVRYDLTLNKGQHDLKIGAEYLRVHDRDCWPNFQRGLFTFSSLPPDIERRFPLDAWNDPSRWDFSGLDATVLRFEKFVAKTPGALNESGKTPFDQCGDWTMDLPKPNYAFWLGDTWKVHDRFSLNLGIRYDLPWGDLKTPGVRPTELVIDNGLFVENVGYRPDRVDANNVAPRVGFSWNVAGDNKHVIRGGTGLFYGHNTSYYPLYQQTQNAQRVITNSWVNDGRPGFVQDPTRGVTVEQILAGTVPRAPQSLYIMAHDYEMPYTWQSTVGFQKQLGPVMSLDADLIHWLQRDLDNARDPNLFYDPATGYNKHPVRFGRPAPEFGPIILWESKGRADYMALATSFTRRYSKRFQSNLAYTYMFFKHDTGLGFVAHANNPFDLDAMWARSTDFQRHTLRANAIWDLPGQFGVAASFLYGSGNYFLSTSNVNPFGGPGTNRVLADMTLIPRNNLKGKPLHSLNLRVSKAIGLVGRAKLSGVAEVFNVYNHANYGRYNGLITSPTYGQPLQSTATAYLPRIWQLGFRVGF